MQTYFNTLLKKTKAQINYSGWHVHNVILGSVSNDRNWWKMYYDEFCSDTMWTLAIFSEIFERHVDFVDLHPRYKILNIYQNAHTKKVISHTIIV